MNVSEEKNFEMLLSQMMSENNETRSKAEDVFNNLLENQPDAITVGLLKIGRTSTSLQHRAFSLIVLRRSMMIANEQNVRLWACLNKEAQEVIKTELLAGVEREEVAFVRNSLCDTIVGISTQIFSLKLQWPQLIPWLFQLTSVENTVENRKCGYNIFSQLAGYFSDFEDVKSNFQIFIDMLRTGISPGNIQIQVSALAACDQFICNFHETPYRDGLRTLIPAMCEIIGHCLNAGEEQDAQLAVQHFIEIEEIDPGFFRPHISMVVDLMLKLSNLEAAGEDIQRLAGEFLVTLAENKPKMCNTLTGFSENCVNTFLKMMLTVEDMDIVEWNKIPLNDDSHIVTSNVAEEFLDRFCIALEGATIVPVVSGHIGSFLNHEDWKYRHTGLMALSMIAEGCRDMLLPSLGNLIDLLLPRFKDPHPRVRWAAINAAGQMSTDFGPFLQRDYHSTVLPRFIELMEDVQNPKVQSHTAAALINFCEKFEQSNVLEQYLEPLLKNLLALIQNSNSKNVVEQTITAIAAVAGCAGDLFIPYYDIFIPVLKSIFTNSPGQENNVVRANTIECISLIAVAVGKQKFLPDAPAVMQLLQAGNAVLSDPKDDSAEYYLQSWTRICSCLGEDFVQFLPPVMPTIIASAEKESAVSVGVSDDHDSPGWDYLKLGDVRIGVHTSALEEKATACNMLFCFASELREGFFPYVDQVARIMVPLMKFFYHDRVRLSSMAIMPHLLNSAKLHLQKNNQPADYLHNLFRYIYPALMDSIVDEDDQEVILVAIANLHECIPVMGAGCLDANHISQFIQFFRKLVDDMMVRRGELVSRNLDGDADESFAIREELSKEDDVTTELAELIGALVKYHPDIFLNQFGDQIQLVLGLLDPSKSPAERQLGVCIFDDIVEHTKEQSFPLFQRFLPILLQYSQDQHAGVRQASCYGLGVCAEHGGETFKPYGEATFQALISVISAEGSRNMTNGAATENAISSVGKILKNHSYLLGDQLTEIMRMWLSWLPLEIDEIEAKVVHEQLTNFILSSHPTIFGNDFAHLPIILRIFAQLLPTKKISKETRKQIADILGKMGSGAVPSAKLGEAFQTLSAEHQQTLQSVLS
eukprot:TRINITY_DN589_c0_g2_i1.p1 TRINITY_DN589_c0_g2~~TRINITY_DN589_c0_g2_i1.p1  ORF type:complete len:1097 (-),score=272.59 TRINITY_DN589_c0_g2_i1:62-3352(-)